MFTLLTVTMSSFDVQNEVTEVVKKLKNWWANCILTWQYNFNSTKRRPYALRWTVSKCRRQIYDSIWHTFKRRYLLNWMEIVLDCPNSWHDCVIATCHSLSEMFVSLDVAWIRPQSMPMWQINIFGGQMLLSAECRQWPFSRLRLITFLIHMFAVLKPSNM